ncbi:hypothetical protein ABEX38_30055 [Priestia megaterium]
MKLVFAGNPKTQPVIAFIDRNEGTKADINKLDIVGKWYPSGVCWAYIREKRKMSYYEWQAYIAGDTDIIEKKD